MKMNSVSPNIFVKEITKTVEFYKRLGFTVDITVPEEGEPVFVLMTCGEVTFMFQTFESLGEDIPEIKRDNGGSLLLYIQVEDILDLYKMIHKEVMVIKELEKTFYGSTEFSIKDINGYILTFSENI
jgi:uncharacterized glyoxalase superfamily protein PhnB